MPLPNAASKARATGCAGTRTAIVSCPPVSSSATPTALRQHERERPRPELRHECVEQRLLCRVERVEVHQRVQPRRRHVHDEWVVQRALLGFEDARCRLCVERIRAQAVDRLSRKGDQPAAPQHGRSLGNHFERRMSRIDDANLRAHSAAIVSMP